jgi:hypothetical protein
MSRRRARGHRACDVVPAPGQERLNQLPLLTSVVVRYGMDSDGCHDTGEALLAAYGFPTTNGPGQHEALGRYLRAVLDKPPADRAARELDRLRRARNQDRYEVSRWVPRRLRTPSRSPGRCPTPPSPGGSRRDPAVRTQSARTPAEIDGRGRRPTTPRTLPQGRACFSVATDDDRERLRPRVIVPLQRVRAQVPELGMAIPRLPLFLTESRGGWALGCSSVPTRCC